MPSLRWDQEAAKAHADTGHLLVSGGNAIGAMELMIASHAIVPGVVLFTNNVSHYSRLGSMLTTASWTEGG